MLCSDDRIENFKKMVNKLAPILNEHFDIDENDWKNVFTFNKPGHGDIMKYTPTEIELLNLVAIYTSAAVDAAFNMKCLYLAMSSGSVGYLFCNQQHMKTYRDYKYISQRAGALSLPGNMVCEGFLSRDRLQKNSISERRNIFKVDLGFGANHVSLLCASYHCAFINIIYICK